MTALLAWLHPSTTFPTAEQKDILDYADHVERKLDTWAVRRRALDLQGDVLSRHEPDDA